MAINMYAPQLLEDMQEKSGGTFPISPLVGSYLVGLANGVAAILSMFTGGFFGRKTIFLTGHALMTFFQLAVGFCASSGYDMASFIGIILFIVSF